MLNLIPAAEAARRAGLNRSSVARRCQAGKVPGAIKVGNVWCIPADVVLTRQHGGWTLGKPRKHKSPV